MVGESQEPVGAGVGGSQAAGTNKTPTLQEYGTNLTTQAAEVSAAAAACRSRRRCASTGTHFSVQLWR